MSKPKIIAIVGPTASGKSDLAIELASHFNGEVISADSRQVYSGLDLGSGKITKEEMNKIPHHLLDVANPKTDTYTGTDFKRDAEKVIVDIINNNRLPIITGGTFFWLELLRGRFTAAPVPPNKTLREKLEKLTTKELFLKLEEKDKHRAENIDRYNRHRLIRSLEIIETLGKVPKATKEDESPYDWLVIGIEIDKETLRKRIESRLYERLEKGMVKEVENLLATGVSAEKLIGFGLEYRYITEYIQGRIDYEEMKRQIITKSLQYAKRQYTWFKRDNAIIWKKFPLNADELKVEIKNFLDKRKIS